jgi:SAM-dependent methyltransferase
MNARQVVERLPRSFRHRVIETVAALRQLRGNPQYDDPAGYWYSPPGTGNHPEAYADSDVRWDIEFIVQTVGRLIGTGGTVLELGCNAGRILHHFARAPYTAIGVEVNPRAVEVGKARFPELEHARFIVGDGADVLRSLPAASVDVSYTSHVLRHVSPASIGVIARELSRVTMRYIITSEDEGSRNHLNFPRNYRRLFEPYGWRQIAKHYAYDLGDRGGVSLTSAVRVFRRDKATFTT